MQQEVCVPQEFVKEAEKAFQCNEILVKQVTRLNRTIKAMRAEASLELPAPSDVSSNVASKALMPAPPAGNGNRSKSASTGGGIARKGRQI